MPAEPERPAVADPLNRTMLAWTRTAIAFAAIGGAMLRVSPLAGLAVLAMSVPIWAVVRRASRAARAMSSVHELRLVTVTVVLVALAALTIAIFGHGPDSLAQLLHGR
jgi:uncharacterized membrane protein YidH (DUF202 family)